MGVRALLGLLLAAGLTFVAGAAQAHPHVWITATSELLYAARRHHHRRAPRLDV
ncbi:ABC-type uncharacterized transport system substrate-binding protein [Bradyrhizobium sp. GM22.5]